jgi:hypothetical protein
VVLIIEKKAEGKILEKGGKDGKKVANLVKVNLPKC